MMVREKKMVGDQRVVAFFFFRPICFSLREEEKLSRYAEH